MSDAELIEYSDNLAKYFKILNRNWIEKYFKLENVDKLVLDNPKDEILSKPGQIYFARFNGKIVGAGAIVNTSDGWELTKLGVDEKYQGFGIGKKISMHLISWAKNYENKKIIIVTNSKLEKAVNLYIKLGFKVIHFGKHPKYKRGNLVLELH